MKSRGFTEQPRQEVKRNKRILRPSTPEKIQTSHVFSPNNSLPISTNQVCVSSHSWRRKLICISYYTGVDILKAQMNARGGQADVSKIGVPKAKDDNGPRSKSLYGNHNRNNSTDDYMMSNSRTVPEPIVEPEIVPMGGGELNSYSGNNTFSYEDPMRPSLNQFTPRKDSLGDTRGRTPLRSSRPKGQEMGPIPSAILNDRFDHYNRPPSRPPSRDRSVDRYASRGQTPVPVVPQELINPRSRAPSAQRTHQDWTPDSGVFEEEIPGIPARTSRRPSRAPSQTVESNGGFLPGSPPGLSYGVPSSQHEAESLLRQRACGQEIPSAMTPGGTVKRTESLYINPIIRSQAQVKVRYRKWISRCF